MSKQRKSSFWCQFCKSCKFKNQRVAWNQGGLRTNESLFPRHHDSVILFVPLICALGSVAAVQAAVGALIGFGGGFAIGAAVGGCHQGQFGPGVSRGALDAGVGAAGSVIGGGVGARCFPGTTKSLFTRPSELGSCYSDEICGLWQPRSS